MNRPLTAESCMDLDTDVLVVGAGPTGLMLANQLVRRGIRTLIIDRNAGPSRETRALGVQARTLEIYSHLGIVDRALELGKRATGGNIWADGQRRARVALSDAGEKVTPYPFLLVLGQDDNERILGDHLRELGSAVEWKTELVSLTQRVDSVTAVLNLPDGSQRNIRAAWVAGCDGARSAVRESNGIEFAGAPYEHVFFVADTEMTGSMVPDEVNVYLFRDGFHLLFPMRGKDHWRIVGILPPALRGKPDLKFDAVIPSLQNEAGEGLSIKSCTWFSTYRIHHRSAVRFRKLRCFLLGDAAHIHSPVGAQGMNTGLQDAYNLAWKLTLVVKNQAKPALLDSYEQERIPVARALLNGTDRAFRLVVSDSWIAGLLRTKILARIAAFAVNRKAVQRMAFRIVSQTGIRYPTSFLSKSVDKLPDTAPQAGDRFPWVSLRFAANGPVEDIFQKLRDTQFNLILIGQPPLPENTFGFGDDFVRAHAITKDATNDKELARAGIPQPSFYLIRPDGYIGLCGTCFDIGDLSAYFAHNLGRGTAGAQQGKERPAASADPTSTVDFGIASR
jgi:2-polyprenyl-6-methoxyphenol hydroxylase-like FAD-dependent oxidoreductase